MTAGFDQAETRWVGDRLCVYQPLTNALCLLNETAGRYWEARSRGQAASDFTQADTISSDVTSSRLLSDLQQLERGWEEVGLVPRGGGRRHKQPPSIGMPLHCGSASPVRKSKLPLALDAAFANGAGGLFRLSVDETHLASLLDAVLAPLRSGFRDGQSVDGALAIEAAGAAAYHIWRDGQLVMQTVDLTTARRVALRNVLFHIWPASGVGGMIHGSAIFRDGKAVLIAGMSGAGKSTLTAAAVADGWSFMCDDLVPVLRCGRRVGRFQTALSVKSGSWPMLADAFPALNSSVVLTLGPRRVRYLALPQSCIGPSEAMPAAIVFPMIAGTVDAGEADANQGVCRVVPLSPSEVLERLIASGSGPDGQPHTIAPLVDLVGRVPGYEAHYSVPSDGCRLLGEVLSP